MSRIKCAVCGLYRGAKPHSGPLHDRIRANRRKLAAGKLRRHRRR